MVFTTKTTRVPLAIAVLHAVVYTSAYPTKEVIDLVLPETKVGGDGGCGSGTKYMQIDTINNMPQEHADYSVTFTQISMECGQPFPSGYTPYSLSGTFKPGDVEPDTMDRSQLNLLLCAPYGNYELTITVEGDFKPQDGKGIGWEIEDGQTEEHIWDTFNNEEYKNPTYNPDRPGTYRFPLEDESIAHMSNYFVGMDPSPGSSECEGFELPPQDEVSGGGGGGGGGGDSGNGGDGGAGHWSVAMTTRLGCYEDGPESRLFEEGYSDASSMTVEDCADFCFDKGSAYFGVENAQECFCGDTLPSHMVDLFDSDCELPCAGDASYYCGGDDAIMVYEFDESAAEGVVGAGSGCFQDAKDDRVLDLVSAYKDTMMTQEMCAAYCSGVEGAEVYGVEYDHECFCGKADSPRVPIDDSMCNLKCAGDDTQNCGGRDAILVFEL